MDIKFRVMVDRLMGY